MNQRIVNSLKNFDSFDTPLHPQVMRLVKIYQVLHFVLNLTTAALSIFSMIFKVVPEVSLLHLMDIGQVLRLSIRLNNANSELLLPFIF